ncbi:MAG: hypothetical protein M3P00_01560 [Gemmatimonadota bacterium]|nr:hypothetical protein [Gemmatimonadota bacterium]MDP9362504.1 hypothetical protein [Acidobacteriota bacterium]
MKLALKVIALTIILFICFGVAAGAVGLSGTSQASEPASGAALRLIAVCFLEVTVLTHLIVRSRWTGWRHMAAVFFVFYGVTTFMPQIESAVFLTRLPAGTVPRLFLMGVLIAAPFSVLAVLILGKARADTADATPNPRLVMTTREWAWKLTVIALAYLILYFTFGYFIAWRNPAVLEYYRGVDEGAFLAHMATVVRDTPWLIPFQIVRAMCWVALALPVIRMMKGQWQETALSLALLFAVVMNAQLLLPNPYMPEPVRMAHLVETASSNFIFGWLTGWLLTRRGVLAFASA